MYFNFDDSFVGGLKDLQAVGCHLDELPLLRDALKFVQYQAGDRLVVSFGELDLVFICQIVNFHVGLH